MEPKNATTPKQKKKNLFLDTRQDPPKIGTITTQAGGTSTYAQIVSVECVCVGVSRVTRLKLFSPPSTPLQFLVIKQSNKFYLVVVVVGALCLIASPPPPPLCLSPFGTHGNGMTGWKLLVDETGTRISLHTTHISKWRGGSARLSYLAVSHLGNATEEDQSPVPHTHTHTSHMFMEIGVVPLPSQWIISSYR